MTTTPDRIDGPALQLEDVAARMADAGLTPDNIANVLGVDGIQVRQALIQRTRLAPEDQALANKTRTLISRCIDQAHWIMDFGTNADRLTMVRTVLPLAGRLMGKEEDTETSGMRVFEELWDSMRVGGNIVDVGGIPEDTG